MATAHHNRRLKTARFRPREPALPTVTLSRISLRLLAQRLRTVRASAVIAAAVLRHQNAHLDAEVASVLQHQIAEPLSENIDHLETLGAGRVEGCRKGDR